MPVYNGLCHAPHLYTAEDVRSIVHGSAPKCTHSLRIRLPLLSPQTGKPYPARNAGELFEEIAADILTGGIFLDNLGGGILDSISEVESAECEAFLFRSSLVSKSILATVTEALGHVTMKQVDFIDWSLDNIAPNRPPRTPAQSTLAIVGMSCRLPGGANNCKLFWDLLKEGRDTHTEVPADRFDLQAHFDPSGQVPNSTPTPWGNFIDQPGMFDAAFFNMSPREVSPINSTYLGDHENLGSLKPFFPPSPVLVEFKCVDRPVTYLYYLGRANRPHASVGPCDCL